MARPARPPDAKNEEALFRVAAEVFVRNGYSGASLNEILRAAGWAKSSFYHYFGSKKALHDRVVSTLRGRLGDGVAFPDLQALSAAEFWPAMARLLEELGRAAKLHPETHELGLMYHRDASSPADGELQRLRIHTEGWIVQAIQRGVDLGVLRQDLPIDLLLELTGALLGVLDRWALERSAHSPAGPDAGRLSLGLVRDLIGVPGASMRG